jgi:signal transduction histidine kinase
VIIFLALLKTKDPITRSFSWFAGLFCLWLVGDLLLWVIPNYVAVYTIWSTLDFVNVLFALAAIYFYHNLVFGTAQARKVSIALILLAIPAFLVTILGKSVGSLDYLYCEVADGKFITYYTLAIEILMVLWVFVAAGWNWVQGSVHRAQSLLVGLALVMFVATFAITDFISSTTGIYEIGLYGLFVLPVSLMVILGVIINGKIFKLETYGVQLGTYSFIVLVASQFLFVQDPTGKVLNIITLIFAVIITLIVTREVSKEHAHQGEIETLNAKLGAANIRLAQLDNQKDEFLSFATHQLRSPLTSIKWGLGAVGDALIDKHGDAETRTIVDHLAVTTNDLISTVNDLLDISKIEQGGLVLKKEEFDIYDTTARIVEEFKITAQKKGLKLLMTGDVKPQVIMGDATKFRQVIVNLVDNAIKYTKEGSVTVSFTHEAKQVRIAVSDTGPGIAADELKQLFDKFIRGAAGKASQAGSGLGLYLARKIVEMHGGKMSVASEGLGKGSTFTVILPIS